MGAPIFFYPYFFEKNEDCILQAFYPLEKNLDLF